MNFRQWKKKVKSICYKEYNDEKLKFWNDIRAKESFPNRKRIRQIDKYGKNWRVWWFCTK